MTERIYYHDSYLTKFSAKVVNRQKENGFFGLVFDKTAFYPTSGGQPHDQGTVNGIPIVKVVDLNNGQILHLLEKDIKKINIDCTINWPTRFDHMQQHSGQHILSQSFLKVTAATTVGFHLSGDYATIDLDTDNVSNHQIKKVEQLSNRIVYENRSVYMKILGQEEVSSLNVRKKSNRMGPIRIIEIEEFDISPCGGTHVKKTAEIGGIFVKSVDRINRGVRIEFLCGQRIIESYRNDLSSLENIAKQLSITPREAPKRVGILLDELKRLRKEAQTRNLHSARDIARTLCNEAFLFKTVVDFSPFLAELKEEALYKKSLKNASGDDRSFDLLEPSQAQLDRWEKIKHFKEILGKTKVIMHLLIEQDCPLKEIAQEIIKQERLAIVLLACQSKNSQLVFAGPSIINLQSVLDGCVKLIGGKGGGSNTFVQGGGCNPSKLSMGLDLALNLVVNSFLENFE